MRRLKLAFLAAVFLSLFLGAGDMTPERRGHLSCTGLGTCGPSPQGPRSLSVKVTSPEPWQASTDLPDGPASWDVDFSSATVKSERLVWSDMVKTTPSIAIAWGGDATSTLVMMRESTHIARTVETSPSATLLGGVTGAAALAEPGPQDDIDSSPADHIDNPADWFYSEVSWAYAQQKSLVGDDDLAHFTLALGGVTAEYPEIPNATSPNGGTWPLDVYGIPYGLQYTLFATPYFRVYDHGHCSVAIPWTDPDHTSQFGSLQQRLPHLKGQSFDSVKLTELQGIVEPWLSTTGVGVTDALGRTYAPVNALADRLFAGGSFNFRVKIHLQFPIPDQWCDGTGAFTVSNAVNVNAAAQFPQRVTFPTDSVDVKISENLGCSAPLEQIYEWANSVCNGCGQKYVDQDIKDAEAEVKARLMTALNPAADSINRAITPLAPTSTEFLRWFQDLCPNVNAWGIGQPGPNDTTDPMFANCRWRQFAGCNSDADCVPPPESNKPGQCDTANSHQCTSGFPSATIYADGRWDRQQWAQAFRRGADAPTYSVSTDSVSAPFAAFENGAIHAFPAPEPNRYTGCLQTVTISSVTGLPISASVASNGLTDDNGVAFFESPLGCAALAHDYQCLVADPNQSPDCGGSLFEAHQFGLMSDAEFQALHDALANVNVTDFECRPVADSPDWRGVAAPPSTWSCTVGPNGTPDPVYEPLCRKQFVWSSEAAKAAGYPPDRMTCNRINAAPPRPTKSASECADIASACGICPPNSSFPCNPPPGIDPFTVGTKCIDYYLFCDPDPSQYCGQDYTSIVEQLCEQGTNQFCEPRCLERAIYCTAPLDPGGVCDTATSDLNPLVTYCQSDSALGCTPSSDVTAQYPFRSSSDIATGICGGNINTQCACNVSGPPAVGDARCALRIPVVRANIMPRGMELVSTDTTNTRWSTILSGFADATVAATNNNLVPFCENHGRAFMSSAGALPALTLQ